VARVPTAILRGLRVLDEEAAQFIKRQQLRLEQASGHVERRRPPALPAWLALYWRPKTRGAETVTIAWQHGAALRGAEPVLRGALPIYVAIIREDGRLDATASYLLRLWTAR
jgi:hypothetical protein